MPSVLIAATAPIGIARRGRLSRYIVSDAVRQRQTELTGLYRASCEMAIRLGVPMVLAAGMDCSVRGVIADMVWREIYNLYDHGLSPMAAIESASACHAPPRALPTQSELVPSGFSPGHGLPLTN